MMLLAAGMLVLYISSGCMYVIRYDGAYEGRVVDADTREPIEGVVVLGTWSIRHHNVAGGYSEYCDAHETVTDKEGEFIIPGQGLRFLSNLEPVSLLIFKAGYTYDGGPWGAFKHPAVADKIKWEGDKPIIPLKKLTMEERGKYNLPSRPSVPLEKMRIITNEINKDRVQRGLAPFGLGGKNNE